MMGSSWNFPARASPSCKGSEPSRAELGHFNFRAENELTILTICISKIPILCLYHDFMFNFMNLYKRIGIFGVKYYNLGT